MKILFYIILFALAYRVIRKLFSPALNNASNQHQHTNQSNQQTTFNSPRSDRSNVVEDIDYEEVE